MSDRIAEAMSTVRRSDFLPSGQQRYADRDRPLPIGHRGTCSQPTTVARMLRMLDARPGQRVLDVGSGSGWTTALLAHLVAPGGAVVGVEIEPDLAEQGRTHLAENGVTGALIEQAIRGTLGWPGRAPYDRILVSAQSGALPTALLDQLADGGRMVIPVAGQMVTAERQGSEVQTSREGWYTFVPLQED